MDILDKHINPTTGNLHVRRLIIIDQAGYPEWLVRLLGCKLAFFVEDTVIDRQEKVHRAVSRNISFRNIMALEEVCEYSPDPSAPSAKTRLEQKAGVQAFPFGLSTVIEQFSYAQASANAHRGPTILEASIRRLKVELAAAEQGIRHAAESAEREIRHVADAAEREIRHVADAAEHQIRHAADAAEREVRLVAAKVESFADPTRSFLERLLDAHRRVVFDDDDLVR
jgi:hypothetical protein